MENFTEIRIWGKTNERFTELKCLAPQALQKRSSVEPAGIFRLRQLCFMYLSSIYQINSWIPCHTFSDASKCSHRHLMRANTRIGSDASKRSHRNKSLQKHVFFTQLSFLLVFTCLPRMHSWCYYYLWPEHSLHITFSSTTHYPGGCWLTCRKAAFENLGIHRSNR